MEYKLTQEDIDFLNQQGISSAFDAQPNMVATESEMAALGIEPDVNPGALPDPAAAAPQMAAPQVAAAMPQVADPVTQQQVASVDTGGGFNIMDKLFGSKEDEQPNQFANLNRQQRMMLAFGAMRDAGMGLQGKESNSFSNTLKAINDQMDMGRKAKAAQAQQAALQSVLGGANVGGQNDFDAQRQRLQQALVAGAIDAPTFTAMMSEIARKQQAGSAEIDLVTGASNVLETIEGMKSRVNNLTTGPLGMAAAMLPWSDASALRNMGTTLESNLAFDTLVALKAAGGTLGAVSEAELKLLKSEIAKFDANMKPQDVIAQLDRVDREYRRLITRAFATTPDVAKLESALGGRPAWLDAPTSSTSEPISDADFIEQERKRREGNG